LILKAWIVGLAAILITVLGAGSAAAETADVKAGEPAAKSAVPADVKTINILMVREQKKDALPPLSLLDLPHDDDGVAGAKLAISDNNTTGKFLKQSFHLDVVESSKPDELIAEVVKRVKAGEGFIVADVAPQTLLAIADAVKGDDAIVLNAGAPDDRLREEDCRANVKHTSPTRSMLADALAQYLTWKRWQKLFLVVGPTPEDKAYADAIRRAAKRFGLKIVEERNFVYETGNRRADGGFEQIQQQIPTFTQNVPAHDVVIVADESEQFGDYFPYRTWDARPVAGTSGLVAMSWHPAMEQWGATQFQNRFQRMAHRTMRPLDYDVWVAVRAIGEAATRKNSTSPKELIAYMKSPDFDLAAFKGQKLTFRAWNGQLREPILIATPKLLVSVSPQQGFLHQFSELDTLGYDKPETKCTAFAK
jgi:ABC transporter substrate binding protein (PQQ-dependent alcohol dehydrogenase system)